MKNYQRGFIPILVIIIAVLVIGGGSAYVIYNKEKSPRETIVPTPSVTESEQPAPSTFKEPSPTVAVPPKIIKVDTKISTQVSTNADVDKVKVIMQEIRTASLHGDSSTLIKYGSKATRTALSGFSAVTSAVTYSSFNIDSVFQAGNVIVTETTVTEQNGVPDKQPMVFIKEDGEWKFDLQATYDYLKNKSSVSSSANGYIDLVVTGIKVYPTHPVVNDPNVEIVVSIKNRGTKTSDKGAPASGELVEFTDAIPTQGGQLSPVNPGETVTWSYKPYKNNAFFKDSDTPGKKTVKITLNEDKAIVESDYNNNIFTQTIDIFNN